MDSRPKFKKSLFDERFFDTAGHASECASRTLSPGVSALMIAVVEGAVYDLIRFAFSKSKKEQSRFRNARMYMFSKEEKYLFDFQHICTILDIDADKIRKKLLQRFEQAAQGNTSELPRARRRALSSLRKRHLATPRTRNSKKNK